MTATLGIICGTGADQLVLEESSEPNLLISPPSLKHGILNGLRVITLPRFHGNSPPHRVSHVNNLSALKYEGASHVISLTACGSLNPHIKPGSLVVPDDVADFTGYPDSTLEGSAHPVAEGEIINKDLSSILIKAARIVGYCSPCAKCCISIRGPRFNTLAESKFYARQEDFDLINMTTAPEATIALELGIPFAILGYVTDWDCSLSVERVSYADIKQRAVEIQPDVQQALASVCTQLKLWD